MKSFQAVFENPEQFNEICAEYGRQIAAAGSSAVIHIYVRYDVQNAAEQLQEALRIVQTQLKGVPFCGCSAARPIAQDGITESAVVMTLTVAEDPSTKFYLFPLSDDIYQTVSVEEILLQRIQKIRGIEILSSMPYNELSRLLENLDRLPEDIAIFGGVAGSNSTHTPLVFAGDGRFFGGGKPAGGGRDESSMEAFGNLSACLLVYAGENLQIETDRVVGWKKIGYPLRVTRADGNIVYELDGSSAYDIYNHYIRIPNDDDFFKNALMFPFSIETKSGDTLIRHAKRVLPDGAIEMSSHVASGSRLHICYGDPGAISKASRKVCEKLCSFNPDFISIFDCMGRMLFWGEHASEELQDFCNLSPVYGFCALGEIVRHHGASLLNNLSIVTVSMREGEPAGRDPMESLSSGRARADFAAGSRKMRPESRRMERKLSLSERLAVFLNTVSAELMEKNEELERLYKEASTDALTGIFNRGYIQKRILDAADPESENYCSQWALIMLDIDDFKTINDTFGHEEGDRALKKLSSCIVRVIDALGIDAVAGRWGGEEFMIFLPDAGEEEAYRIAERIRQAILSSDLCKGKKITVSSGVTRRIEEENVQNTLSRVDANLYRAKDLGKNRTEKDAEE